VSVGQPRCPLGHDQFVNCVFCGAEHPWDASPCPVCGSAWLQAPEDGPPSTDRQVGDLPKPPRPSDEELTAATLRQPWRLPGEDDTYRLDIDTELIELRESARIRRSAARWREIGRYAAITVVAVGLVGLASYAFGEWGGRVSDTTPTVAAITAIPQTAATQPATQPKVSVAATNATAPTPAPTTTISTTPHVTPLGDAIAIDDLRLTIYGIGGLRIGDPADEVAGVLTATFGQPESVAPAEPGLAHPGACPGSASRVLRWGILEITIDNGVFAGYRLDASLGDPDSATAALRTASGLQVGATISTLETIYQSYQIVYGETPGFGATFSLQRNNGEELLWGPISSTDRSGVVLGVYSPTRCD